MSWLSSLPVLLVAVVVVFVPGFAAALLLRLRGFSLLAVAAPLSIAAIAGASVVNVVVPFRWGPLAWAVCVVVLLAVAFLVGRLGGSERRAQGGHGEGGASTWTAWLPFVSVAIAVCLIAPRLADAFGQPGNISQTFDNVYHLNSVRHMVDTGFIAPLRQIVPGFYPSLWHALPATIVMLSGSDIPTAINMVSIVLGAVVWPVGCVWLTRQITGDSAATFIAGPLSAAFAAFPLLMLDFGVLYPNVLSISLLPAGLAALIAVCGLGTGTRPPPATRWGLLLATVAAIALAHPSTLMAFFAIGIWPAAWSGVRWFAQARARRAGPGLVVAVAGAWLAGLAAAALLLFYARPTRAQAFWPPTMSAPEAMTQFVLNGPVLRPWEITVSVLVLLGVIVIIVWQRGRLWLVLSWLTIGSLYVICASFPESTLRYRLTGTWYSDLYRIAALAPTVALPLAAVAFAALVGWSARLLTARQGGRRALGTQAAVAGAGVAAIVVLTQFAPALQVATASARGVYAMTDESWLLTPDERALIDRLPDHVSPDEVIFGSPWTGTSLSYALADRRVLTYHIFQELDRDMEAIAVGLNRAETGSAVCGAVERTNARWVLDFGDREVHGSEHPYPGLQRLDESDAVELVDSQGPDAKLYRVVACD